MQLGFVIDHGKCIGCHACTVACKAENGVPVGSFRTWVKYTERGSFPEVKRSFAVLRCNQCTHAPCVTICPVAALQKRPDGIVDVDPAACIGCKACMQGCPYDALYINADSGTAEKCHFCAHRTERGLAPACAVVCPTEAIIPGDFHDNASEVWKIRAGNGVAARKPEAGTGPNVYYREVGEAGIDPLQTDVAGGYLWADRPSGAPLDVEQFLAAQEEAEARARTTYDVDHAAPWGGKITGYLFAKSLAAGSFLAIGSLLWPAATASAPTAGPMAGLAAIALLFLALTGALLVADLKRPERFYFILSRPNWSSWLTRGTLVLVAFGALLLLWIVAAATGAARPLLVLLYAIGCILAVLTACYTGWLFEQAKARVLWMRRGLWLHLIVQALIAGTASALLLQPLLRLSAERTGLLRWALVGSLLAHALFLFLEPRLFPALREREFRQAHALVRRGPFAARHLGVGIVLGVLLPVVALSVAQHPLIWAGAALASLVGLYSEEDVLVRAGQALPIS